MEQSSIGPKPDFIDDGGLEVDKHGPGHVLPGPGLREEGVEGVIAPPNGLIGGHGAIGLDPVLEAVELPTGVTYLGSSLTDMDRDTLPL